MSYSTTSNITPWGQPYAQGFLDRAQQVADQPFQGYEGDRVAGFNPWQQQALQGTAQRAMDGSPVTQAAQQELASMIQGQGPQSAANPYMGANPYLQQQIDQAQGDVIRNWNLVQAPSWGARAVQSGSVGNSGIEQMYSAAQGDLQRNLGQIASDMRFRDYGLQAQLGESAASRADAMASGNQSRLLQALGLAPQMAEADYNDMNQLLRAGTAFQAQDQRMLDDGFARFREAQMYPQQQLDIMGNALRQSGAIGGSQTTDTPDPNRLLNAAGGALTFAQLAQLISGG